MGQSLSNSACCSSFSCGCPHRDDQCTSASGFSPINTEGVVFASLFLFSSHNLGVQEMTVVYNITNEPWPKYNMAAIADRGLKPSQWTSARFQTQVLLVETARYTCSSSCPRGDCQVHLLFFLCLWRLPGTSALLLVLMETARYICSSSCACGDCRYISSSSCGHGKCQVHLLFFLCLMVLIVLS